MFRSILQPFFLPLRRLIALLPLLAVLAASLLSCRSGEASSKSAPADLVRVFTNGTEGYACFRIPAILRTPHGTLLAFAEARRSSCADFGDVRIVMRRSRNGGKTWGPLETVAENGSLQADNASPVVDLLDPRFPRGRVFLIYTTGNAPEPDVLQGKGTRRVWYRTSLDEGVTWTAPVELTSSVKLPSWREYATGPGHALQLTQGAHAGRIIIAAYHSQGPPLPDGRAYEANTFYSDDHGSTWKLGGTVNAPGSNESTLAQSAGGVVLNSRDQARSQARTVSISADGSESWRSTFVARDLPDPQCEGSMIRYAAPRARSVLLFSNPGNRTERRDLTISVSFDGGWTWPKHTVLYPGPASYSDIVLLPKGRLGVLWECGDPDGIVFLKLALKPLL